MALTTDKRRRLLHSLSPAATVPTFSLSQDEWHTILDRVEDLVVRAYEMGVVDALEDMAGRIKAMATERNR